MASKKGKPAPLGEASTKKGSKIKEPPPPSPRTLAALEQKAAEERAERDGAVQEFLTALLERVDALEEEKEIQSMLIPYAVDRVLDEAMKALEMVMLPKPVDWREEGTRNWAPDGEPEVPVIDSWARGAIPIKKRPPPAVSEPRSPTLMSPSGLSRTTFKSGAGSGASVRASRSPSRRVSISGGSVKGDRAESVVSNSRINTSAMKRLVDLSARAPLPNLPDAAPPLPQLMQEVQARKKELASANAEEDQRLREELAARQAQEKLRKEREERDAAEAARLAAEAQKALSAEKAGGSEGKNNMSRARSKRSLTKQDRKSGGATSATSTAPPPVLSQAPANGSAKPVDGKEAGKLSGKAGVSEITPVGLEKAGALEDSSKQPSEVPLQKGPNGVRSSGGLLQKRYTHVVKPGVRKSGEGLKPAASTERRAAGLVLPVIEKPKSR